MIQKSVLSGAAEEMNRLLKAAKVYPPQLPSMAQGSALETRLTDQFITRIQDNVTAGEWEGIVCQAAHLARLAMVAAEDGLR